MTVVDQSSARPADRDVADGAVGPGGAPGGQFREVFDPSRGRRRLHLDESGVPDAVELADASMLRIRRDPAAGTVTLTGDDGGMLLHLAAEEDGGRVARSLGLTGPVAAGVDGVHRLAATDLAGVTRTELHDRSVRVQRGDDVLRIDADRDGRPRWVTLPGGVDLDYHPSADGWDVGLLGGPELLRIEHLADGLRISLGAESWPAAADSVGDRAAFPGSVPSGIHGAASGGVQGAVSGGAPRAVPVAVQESLTPRRHEVRCDGAVFRTLYDDDGRVVGRTSTAGGRMRYQRDSRGRLIAWERRRPDGTVSRTERRYSGGDLSALVSDGRRSVVRSDDGGRVLAVLGPSGTIRYEYDLQGRRTSRTDREGTTSYGYDQLGQLTELVRHDGSTSRFGWDALGRRIWVEHDGRRLLEHRDPSGRLWSITTAEGALVNAFVWWGDRVLARLDADERVDEIYLTDPVGTLLGTLSRATGWRCEQTDGAPFGSQPPPGGSPGSPAPPPGGGSGGIAPPPGGGPSSAAPQTSGGPRPTLFGHITDGRTPLICCGARELDPELGMFLTPDPWSGALDDPRRLAGEAAATLPSEQPAAGVHPYLLSQGDPLSRPDLDGHFAVGTFLLGLILAPTWGFPLTSVSVFLFFPLNLYFEVIGLLGFVFSRHHWWPHHSIFNLRFLSGSSRQATLALALNGFWPRALIGDDRCITIGHVVWENRHYFNMLDRARVLELDDVRGTPRADGTPTGDARAFKDTRQGSILVITSTDTDRRNWVHASWWTRGPGNAVGLRGADQSFEDRTVGGGHARGTVYLAQPMPEIMPTPRKAGDKGALSVTEYTPTLTSDATLVDDVWFAFEAPSGAGLNQGAVVEIAAGSITPAYAVVQQILDADPRTSILDHLLPTRFSTAPPALRKKLKVRVVTPATIAAPAPAPMTSANWASRAGLKPMQQFAVAADPGHPVAKDDVVELKPTTPDPATPERKNAYTRIEAVTAAITLTPPVSALALSGASVFRLATDGTPVNGTVADLAHRDQISVTGRNPLKVDDLIRVQPASAGAGAQSARVMLVTDAIPAVPAAGGTPGTPAKPAQVTVDPPLTVAAIVAVRVTRLKPTDRAKDVGTGAVQSGDTLTVTVDHTGIFAPGQPVLIESGADRHVRQVGAIGAVNVDTVDEAIGTGPWTLTVYRAGAQTTSTSMAAGRFVEWTGNSQPSAYGSWPAEVMGLAPVAMSSVRQPTAWRFFLRSTPRPVGLHPKFRDFWEPVTVGGKSYWLLTNELKIVQDHGSPWWEPDPDDPHPRRYRVRLPAGPVKLTVRAFATSVVTRPDAGGGPVLAFPAEAQVPEEPAVRWSFADSLAEHELTHTVQNTYWGPLLIALPVQGIFRSIRDIGTARGKDWELMKPFTGEPGFEDSNVWEWLSMAGIMRLLLQYVVAGPLLLDKDTREKLWSASFDDWDSVLNPVTQKLLEAVPRVDKDVPDSQDWLNVLGNLLTKALDMRSWMVPLGLVPWLTLLHPNSPKSFLEQGASRTSGDLYSHILTVNDKFNATLAFARDKSDADITTPLGSTARLMTFNSSYGGRNLELDACDAPGSHLRTVYDYFSVLTDSDILRFTPTADALLPADLYEPVPPAAAPAVVRVDGPTPTGGGAAPVVELLKVPGGTAMRPRLRAIVPVPPRVFKALGCYLLPAGPGVWKALGVEPNPGPPDTSAHTAEATITVDSSVTLGGEDVAWGPPAASGSGPAPGVVTLQRFVTEKQPLVVAKRNTSTWAAQADPGKGVTLTARSGGTGWDLSVAAPGGVVALPVDARVRIWAKVDPADTQLFDLVHPEVPTLKNRRSYLDTELWIPVRDFIVKVEDLPPLPAVSMDAGGSVEVETKVKLTGSASIVQVGNLLAISRVGDAGTRGEKWRFAMGGLQAVERTAVVKVTVKFGSAPTVDRPFDLTINPNFTLDAAAFDATVAAPLDLTITGGSAPFTVVDQPPNSTRAKATISGSTVTVKIDPPPPTPPLPPGAPVPPPPPALPPVTFKLVVKDSAGKRGVRTVTLHP